LFITQRKKNSTLIMIEKNDLYLKIILNEHKLLID